MAIIGTLPLTLTNGTLEDATQVMSLFSWIQSQTNGNACPATTGSAVLKGNGAGGTATASPGVDYVAPGGAVGTLNWAGTSTGSANAQILTPATAITAYSAGLALEFIAGFSNSGALQINVSGLGLVNVFKDTAAGPAALAANEVFATNRYRVTYDGTQFILLNPSTWIAAVTATNLAGGGAGQIPYQSAAATTAMLAAGTSGQFLKSNGAAPPSWSNPIISGTTVVTTSGANIDFTSLPSGITTLTVLFSGVSTTGTNAILIQVGSLSGGIEVANYLGSAGDMGDAAANAVFQLSSGFYLAVSSALATIHGSVTLFHMGSNIWTASGTLGLSNNKAIKTVGGSIAMASVLDRVRITTVGGTDTFDAGKINIVYQ